MFFPNPSDRSNGRDLLGALDRVPDMRSELRHWCIEVATHHEAML